jgi:hypothetical protein
LKRAQASGEKRQRPSQRVRVIGEAKSNLCKEHILLVRGEATFEEGVYDLRWRYDGVALG